MKLVIASNNKGKIREYKQLLEPMGYEVMSQSEAGLTLDVEETGTTFAENSALKARAAYEQLGCAVLADDSGLAVEALNGEPGVYSARYGGLDSDAERCEYLLKKLENVPNGERTAYFICTIHFIGGDGSEITAEGRVYGEIGREQIGGNGFGYDPVFMFGGRSFAQIPAEEKNAVSHRANALNDLKEKLKNRSTDGSESIERQAVKSFGKTPQMIVAIEELSELIKELTKNLRGKDNVGDISEEMADVNIMLRQLEVIFDNSSEVKAWEQRKLERIASWLNNKDE